MTCFLSAAPAGTNMCLSWCCRKPAWWAMWILSLSWMPTSSTFLISRSLYWRTKHPGWAKSMVRTLLWHVSLRKYFNHANKPGRVYCFLHLQCFEKGYHVFFADKVLEDVLFVFPVSAKMNWDFLFVAIVASWVFCSYQVRLIGAEKLSVWMLLLLSLTETAVDRQISFPLSNVLHANGERNGQPVLHDFTEDIQFMDVEETSGKEFKLFSFRIVLFWIHKSWGFSKHLINFKSKYIDMSAWLPPKWHFPLSALKPRQSNF